MGQVSTSDDHCLSSQFFDRTGKDHSQFIVVGEWKSGKADTHDLPAFIFIPYKPQRHHRAMIEFRFLLPQCAAGEVLGIRDLRYLIDKILVIVFGEFHARRTKTRKGTLRMFAGRYMEIIGIKCRMRTCDDDRFRLK